MDTPVDAEIEAVYALSFLRRRANCMHWRDGYLDGQLGRKSDNLILASLLHHLTNIPTSLGQSKRDVSVMARSSLRLH